MPAKKSAPQKARSSDMGMLWKWVYVVGLVVTGLVTAFNFTAADPYLGMLLLLAAILSGIFFLESDDVVNFAIRFLLLVAASTVFAALSKGMTAGPAFLGTFFNMVAGFFTGVVNFLAPASLTLLIVHFWKKYFSM
jgi:hypothetical protein